MVEIAIPISTPDARLAGRSSFLTAFRLVWCYGRPGAKQVICGMPVTVSLVDAVCGNLCLAFCARSE